MKTYYLPTLAIAMAFSSYAGNTNGVDGSLLQSKASYKTVIANHDCAAAANMASIASATDRNVRMLGARKADDNASIEGTWTFYMGDYYTSVSIDATVILEYTATLSDGEVVFEDSANKKPPFYAEYDNETGVLTFNKKFLGKIGGYYAYQDPFIYNYSTNQYDYQTITGRFVDNVELLFEPDNAIAWPAYNDPDEKDRAGFYTIYDLEGATKFNEDDAADDANWTTVGNAQFVDPWVTPGLGYNQWNASYQWDVPLQSNNHNPGIYRLVDPYHRGPLAGSNTTKIKGYIIFDVSDPDHVVFLTSPSGFAYSSAEITQFYCTNQLSYYMDRYGYTPEEIVSLYGDDFVYTTFKDGVVSLGSLKINGKVEYDANFGIQDNPIGGLTWEDTDMTGQIVFPEATGIDGVHVENAGVRYFSLQGLEVRDPQPGTLLIRVEGSKAMKVII